MIHSTTRYCSEHEVKPPRKIVAPIPAVIVIPALTLMRGNKIAAIAHGMNEKSAQFRGYERTTFRSEGVGDRPSPSQLSMARNGRFWM